MNHVPILAVMAALALMSGCNSCSEAPTAPSSAAAVDFHDKALGVKARLPKPWRLSSDPLSPFLFARFERGNTATALIFAEPTGAQTPEAYWANLAAHFPEFSPASKATRTRIDGVAALRSTHGRTGVIPTTMLLTVRGGIAIRIHVLSKQGLVKHDVAVEEFVSGLTWHSDISRLPPLPAFEDAIGADWLIEDGRWLGGYEAFAVDLSGLSLAGTPDLAPVRLWAVDQSTGIRLKYFSAPVELERAFTAEVASDKPFVDLTVLGDPVKVHLKMTPTGIQAEGLVVRGQDLLVLEFAIPHRTLNPARIKREVQPILDRFTPLTAAERQHVHKAVQARPEQTAGHLSFKNGQFRDRRLNLTWTLPPGAWRVRLGPAAHAQEPDAHFIAVDFRTMANVHIARLDPSIDPHKTGQPRPAVWISEKAVDAFTLNDEQTKTVVVPFDIRGERYSIGVTAPTPVIGSRPGIQERLLRGIQIRWPD